jgi:hypothetical protein
MVAISVNVIDSRSVETAGASYDAMDIVALVKEELCKI